MFSCHSNSDSDIYCHDNRDCWGGIPGVGVRLVPVLQHELGHEANQLANIVRGNGVVKRGSNATHRAMALC